MTHEMEVEDTEAIEAQMSAEHQQFEETFRVGVLCGRADKLIEQCGPVRADTQMVDCPF